MKLLSLSPELSKQWHPTKNLPLTPDTVGAASARKVWWRCELGHEWQASISMRSRGCGCPYCYGRYPSPENNLLVKRPDMAAQWHPTKNGRLKPENVLPGSPNVIHWICEKGHEWAVSISGRVRSDCPTCANDVNKKTRGRISLASYMPELIEEWHPERNLPLTPHDVTFGSTIKVWWICEFGHCWLASPKKRVKGTNCPYCSGRYASPENNLEIIIPRVAAEWHPTKNGDLKPNQVTPASHLRVWWLCRNGHSWQQTVICRNSGNNCPQCAKLKYTKKSAKKETPDDAGS